MKRKLDHIEITIVGAAGSGKTSIAQFIKDNKNQWDHSYPEVDRNIVIVEGNHKAPKEADIIIRTLQKKVK